MPEFFEQRYIMLKGPFTPKEFSVISERLRRYNEVISAFRSSCNAEAPFCDVYIPTRKKDLAPFGRKIIAGISSLAMAIITCASFMNIVR